MPELIRTANQIKERLRTVPGLVDLDSNFRPGRPEVRVIVDRDKAADLGVSTAQVATAIQAMVGGEVATIFRESQEETDICVRLQEKDRQNLTDISGLYVPSVRGTLVDLPQVASLEVASGPTQIDRQDRARQIIVGGNLLKERALGDVLNEAKARLADLQLPNGVSFKYGGQAEQMAESFKSLGVSLILAIIFVYMVLASQFGSFSQPFIIMLALPLAIVGALLGLLVANKIFDTMAFIGVIMLMGLVTKNSILLIDYTNTLRRRGYNLREAILEAGPTRLRPILMTTAAMILGMLPVALAIGVSTEFRVPMAVVVIGGLITSTLLTLVVVPVVYSLFEGARRLSGSNG